MHRKNNKAKPTTIGKRKLELCHGNNLKPQKPIAMNVAHRNVPMNLYNNVINRRKKKLKFKWGKKRCARPILNEQLFGGFPHSFKYKYFNVLHCSLFTVFTYFVGCWFPLGARFPSQLFYFKRKHIVYRASYGNMCVAIQEIQKPFVYWVRFSSNSDVPSNKRVFSFFRFKLPVIGALTLRIFLFTKITTVKHKVYWRRFCWFYVWSDHIKIVFFGQRRREK